jgi:hypothetical protein
MSLNGPLWDTGRAVGQPHDSTWDLLLPGWLSVAYSARGIVPLNQHRAGQQCGCDAGEPVVPSEHEAAQADAQDEEGDVDAPTEPENRHEGLPVVHPPGALLVRLINAAEGRAAGPYRPSGCRRPILPGDGRAGSRTPVP